MFPCFCLHLLPRFRFQTFRRSHVRRFYPHLYSQISLSIVSSTSSYVPYSLEYILTLNLFVPIVSMSPPPLSYPTPPPPSRSHLLVRSVVTNPHYQTPSHENCSLTPSIPTSIPSSPANLHPISPLPPTQPQLTPFFSSPRQIPHPPPNRNNPHPPPSRLQRAPRHRHRPHGSDCRSARCARQGGHGGIWSWGGGLM